MQDASFDAVGDGGDVEAPHDAAWTPGPVAPVDERLEVPIGQWMVTTFPDYGATAQLRHAIESGALQVPDVGHHYGSQWVAFAPGENGQIKVPGFGPIIYAIARVDAEEPIRAMANPKGAAQVIVGTRRQPGDMYLAGKHLIPLTFDPGSNILVVMAYFRGQAPEFQIHSSQHELVFNPNDLTFPDLRAGQSDSMPMGLPVLNMTHGTVTDAVAIVVANGVFAGSSVELAPLGPQTTTQVPFELVPGPDFPTTEETEVVARVRIESPSLEWSYEEDLTLTVRAADFDGAERFTFRSSIDDSTQYFGLRRPTGTGAGEHALVLSLHGASVEARGQAAAYSAKEDVMIVAPTNRRPFGFDWESFGRLDAIEVLDLAQSLFPVDPTRVYLTGHSMGGHGSWQLGTLFPGRFALVGPSAGWISFATYGGAQPYPTGPIGWSSFSSDTLEHVVNLAKKAVYIIHGTADDNVPIAQAETMFATLSPFVEDLHFHKEAGAGHWWDGDVSPGADCVDWPPLFELMSERFLDPYELDFFFISPSPAISPTHSYVTVVAAYSPGERIKLTSKQTESVVTLTAENVVNLRIDGGALMGKGIDTVVVNGSAYEVRDEVMTHGSDTAKHPEAYGPLVQVFYRPFCLVYGEEKEIWRDYAAFLVSTWNIIGNGHACMLPLSELDEDLLARRNIVYVGVPASEVPFPAKMPVDWSSESVSVGDASASGLLAFVFPTQGRLGAVLTTTEGAEQLLFRIQPFSSRFWLPDYLILGQEGLVTTGFFDKDWTYSASLKTP